MIYLVRHGESLANVQKKYSGRTDVELSHVGREQAKEAGIILKNETIAHVYSSPLKRAKDTAKIICEVNNIDEANIKVEDCLVEVNFGLFENKTWEELRENYREETDKWIVQKHKFKFPGGESYEDIQARIAEFIDNIPDNSLIVTHFGVIQSILLYFNIVDDNNLWNLTIKNCDILIINNRKIERIIRRNNLASTC